MTDVELLEIKNDRGFNFYVTRVKLGWLIRISYHGGIERSKEFVFDPSHKNNKFLKMLEVNNE